MPKKVRPGSKRLPPWQTPQTQCRGSYSRKMSKKGVFEQAKDTFSQNGKAFVGMGLGLPTACCGRQCTGIANPVYCALQIVI